MGNFKHRPARCRFVRPLLSAATLLVGVSFSTAFFCAHEAAAAPQPPHYHLVKTIPLTGVDGWDYLTFDAPSQRLYIARSTHVSIVNVKSGKVEGEIADLSGVHGVALDVKAGHGFTSNGRSNSVTMFDLKTFKKLKEIPVGEGPDAILFDPATKRVFTFNGRGHSTTALDAATGTVLTTLPLPGKPEFAVSDGKGHLYNNLEDKSEVDVINAQTLKVEMTWTLGTGEAPSGLAIDRKNRRLFAVCDNQKMVVLNADSGQVVATPVIGNGPDAAAFDPKTHLAFSSNGEDGTLTVVHETTANQYRVLATIPTQEGARTMALDESTHHVFTVAAQQLPAEAAIEGTPSTPQPRRRRGYAPNTFVILEYAP